MKYILKISALIALLATTLDWVFHIAFITSPLSPPLYFIAKFGIGVIIAFLFIPIEFGGLPKSSVVYGVTSGVLFTLALFAIPNLGGTFYTIIPHLAHIGVYGIAYYLVMKLEIEK